MKFFILPSKPGAFVTSHFSPHRLESKSWHHLWHLPFCPTPTSRIMKLQEHVLWSQTLKPLDWNSVAGHLPGIWLSLLCSRLHIISQEFLLISTPHALECAKLLADHTSHFWYSLSKSNKHTALSQIMDIWSSSVMSRGKILLTTISLNY